MEDRIWKAMKGQRLASAVLLRTEGFSRREVAKILGLSYNYDTVGLLDEADAIKAEHVERKHSL